MLPRALTIWGTALSCVAFGTIVAPAANAANAPEPFTQTPSWRQAVGDFDGDGKLDRAMVAEKTKSRVDDSTMTCAVKLKFGNGSKKTITVTLKATKKVPDGSRDYCPNIVKTANVTGVKADQLALGNYGKNSPQYFTTWYLSKLDGTSVKTPIVNDKDDTPIFNDFTGDGKTEAIVVDSMGHPFVALYKPAGNTVTSVAKTLPGPRNAHHDCGLTDELAALRSPQRKKNLYITVSRAQCKTKKTGVYFLKSDHTFTHVLEEKTGERFWTAQYVDLDGDGQKNDLKIPVNYHDPHKWRTEDRYYRTAKDGSLTLVKVVHTGGAKPGEKPQDKNPKPYQKAVQARGDRVVMTHRVHETGDIPVLKNDRHAAGGKVTIVKPPRVGTAKVLADGRIHYDRRGKGTQSDLLVYKVTAPNGTSATARLVITMRTSNSKPGKPGTSGKAVVARGDRVIMTHRVHETGDIPVLKNDRHAAGGKVTIVKPPRVGTAKVLADGRIHYDRRGKGTQADLLVYKVTAPNGTSATARLVITMRTS